ncbi:MAG: tripartite tricarboxylate transporter TctB family protein [Spirochaetales bacterium]|jgi:hypothetical protein|nr:tripartite tricarboxylate transporter TctB family protein [Spirochaetales bacterium]
MAGKRKINNDVYIGILLTALSGFLFYETSKIHPEAAQFPKVMIAAFIIMSVLLVFFGIRKTLNPALTLKSDTLLKFRVIRTPLIVFGVVVIYLALIRFTGFFIATFIFVPVFMIFYGVKSIRALILTDVLLNLFVYGLFVRLLKVMLP